MLLLTGVAAAKPAMDTGFGCGVPTIGETIPGAGVTGFPVDARLVALLGTCDVLTVGETLELVRQDDGSTVDEVDITDAGSPPILALVPSAELEANTAYTFRITPDEDWGEASEVGFTTGYDRVVGLSGAPSIRVTSAPFERGTLAVEYEVTPAADPDRASLVIVTEANEGVEASVFVPSSAEPAGFKREGTADLDEVCLSVTQVDGRGDETKGDPACLAVDRACGCATGANAGGPALVGLAALAAFRRRKR